MTLVSVKGGSARLSHRRRKHRWQLKGAKQLSELRSAKAPVAAETARDLMANEAAGDEEAKFRRFHFCAELPKVDAIWHAPTVPTVPPLCRIAEGRSDLACSDGSDGSTSEKNFHRKGPF